MFQKKKIKSRRIKKKKDKVKYRRLNEWRGRNKVARSEINASLSETRQLDNINDESKLSMFQKHINNGTFVSSFRNVIALLMFVIIGLALMGNHGSDITRLLLIFLPLVLIQVAIMVVMVIFIISDVDKTETYYKVFRFGMNIATIIITIVLLVTPVFMSYVFQDSILVAGNDIQRNFGVMRVVGPIVTIGLWSLSFVYRFSHIKSQRKLKRKILYYT